MTSCNIVFAKVNYAA